MTGSSVFICAEYNCHAVKIKKLSRNIPVPYKLQIKLPLARVENHDMLSYSHRDTEIRRKRKKIKNVEIKTEVVEYAFWWKTGYFSVSSS